MLEWLLKVPPAWYADGSLAIAWPGWLYALAVAAAAAVLLWLTGYRRLRGGTGAFALRLLLAAVLLLALARPTLVSEVAEPIPGHVAVVLDDSLSLRLAGTDGVTGAERMAALVSGAPPSLTAELDERFDTRYFRFGEGIHSVQPRSPLHHADARSELGAALLQVATRPDAGSLAAVVLISDGGGDSPHARAGLDAALTTLRAADVAVHTVDVAPARTGPDLEVTELRVPRRVHPRDEFPVTVALAWRGLSGERVVLTLEDDGVIVDRHELTLPEGREQLRLQRRLSFEEAGGRLLTARITRLPGETETRNNQRERSVVVLDEPIRVLHFEGEPRYEVKFIRRAVAGDPAIHLTSLIRTADNKYYRIGVKDPGELAGGFPDEPEALFRYHVLLLGSVEATLLSRGQQAAIRDFVARRGGGLLLLGGRHAYARGGHDRSLLAELMPVRLANGSAGVPTHVAVRPTTAGRSDPMLDFAGDSEATTPFSDLPRLTVLNPLREAKLGARTLLQGIAVDGDALIVLARHRYGRGQVAAFPVADSWRWQMSVANAPEDQTHERLWRAIIRDLARHAGARVRTELAVTQAIPGEAVTVSAQALDALHHPAPGAELTLAVTSPLGEIRRYPMTRSTDGAPGWQSARFVPRTAGRHELAVTLPGQGDDGAGDVVVHEHVDVTATGDEFHGQGDGRRLLATIAATTGGHLVDAADAPALTANIDDTLDTRTVVKRLALWDAPILLLTALTLLCAEWLLRRGRGLA